MIRARTNSTVTEAAGQISETALTMSHVGAICGDALDHAYVTIEQRFLLTTVFIDVADVDQMVLATDRLHDAGIICGEVHYFDWHKAYKATFDDTTVVIGVRLKARAS